jgi:tyrosine-specific transport protein
MKSFSMKNHSLGGVLLIAGTTIGAGMLAMPLVCAALGLTTTMILLVALWGLTTYSALLLVEVHQYADPGMGLTTLANRYLGRTGYWITHIALLGLLYSLTAAYLTAGGEQLAAQLSHGLAWSVTPPQGTLLLTVVTAGLVSGGSRLVDSSNRLLFSLKMVVLLLMLLLIAPHVQSRHLLATPQNHRALLAAIPVLLTAFSFHATLPSVLNYLEDDVRQWRYVVLAGSAIPLVCYLAWQWAIQGLLDQPYFLTVLAGLPNLSGLMQALQNSGVPPRIDSSVRLFAALALATSLLGVTLGLFDHWHELLQPSNNRYSRLKAGLCTFLPPLGFALAYPKGFMLALGYAAMALAILALLLPAALVWKIRQQEKPAPYRVRGGGCALWLLLLCGLLMFLLPLAIREGC